MTSAVSQVLELPIDFSVDWPTLISLLILSMTIVVMGNKVSMHIINKKTIVQVLK